MYFFFSPHFTFFSLLTFLVSPVVILRARSPVLIYFSWEAGVFVTFVPVSQAILPSTLLFRSKPPCDLASIPLLYVAEQCFSFAALHTECPVFVIFFFSLIYFTFYAVTLTYCIQLRALQAKSMLVRYYHYH